MAIDNPSQDVELRVQVVDDLVAAIRRLEDYNDTLKKTDKNAQAAVGTFRKGVDELNGVSKAAKDTGSALSTIGTQAPAISAVGDAASKTRTVFAGLSDSELPRLRYALYDVASTANVTALAITAMGAASFAAAASFESSFTNVERTLDPAYEGVDQLRQSLLNMAREVPVAFGDLAQIATLGNQLGIAGDNVDEFTGTVSRFAAVTGVSVEEASKAFGAMQYSLDVPADEFENLGSAIALVGRTSVATEPEILALTREIGTQAHQAGFAADEVVALAGTLGQLRVPPERARGSLTTYFQTLYEAVSEGGEKLQNFATVTGLTAEQLDKMVRSGQGVEVFQRFVDGLGNAGNVVEVTSALDELGLSQLRVSDVFQRLAQNGDTFTQFLATGKQGYTEGGELARQYALVLDDLSSKWQLLVNGALEFASAIGTSVAPAAKVFLDIIASILNGLTDFVNTPAGAALSRMAVLFAAVTAAIAFTVGGAALFIASLAAVKTAITVLNLEAFVGRLGGVALGLLGTSKAAWLAADGLGKARIAVIGLMRATVVLGLIQLLVSALYDLRGAGYAVIDVMTGVANAAVGVARIASDFVSGLPGGGVFQQWTKEWSKGLQVAQKEIGNFSRDAHKEWGNFSDDMGWAVEDVDEFSDSAIDAMAGTDDWAGSLDDLGNSAGDAAAKVRTLADYAGDLQGVFSRAFEIRFGGAQGLDTITTGWSNIRDAADAAAQAARDHQNALAGLNADRSIKEYWLSVAEMYGDELRAAKLRADLAEINGKVADTSKDLATEQQKASMTLTGNTAAAVANRASLLGLVGNYGAYIQALAASGMSQADLAAQSATLKQEFINQATQMGFNREEIGLYAASFDDLSYTIANVPRDITVTANVNPAVQALNEFFANAASNAFSAGQTAGSNYGAGLGSGVANTWKNPFADMGYTASSGRSAWRASSGNGFASGGYTGGGGVNAAAGIVHGQEFVFSAPAVRNLGVGTLNNMHAAAKSGRSFATGNSGPGGPTGPIRLDSWSIQALASAIAPATFLDGQRISSNVGMHNANSTALGAN